MYSSEVENCARAEWGKMVEIPPVQNDLHLIGFLTVNGHPYLNLLFIFMFSFFHIIILQC